MVTGYRDAWTLLEHYPHATLAVLDRAGHEWPLPEPQQQHLFAALVGDWLNRVEESEAIPCVAPAAESQSGDPGEKDDMNCRECPVGSEWRFK